MVYVVKISESIFHRFLSGMQPVPIILLALSFLASCSLFKPKVWTPVEVIASQERLVDRTIIVRGQLEQLYLHCTEEGCDPERPCCNVCTGGVGFLVGWEEILWEGEGLGCEGNNCDVKCTPAEIGEFFTVKGTLYFFNGVLRLRVESYSVEG
jgi:hypothetical protein